VSSRGLGDVYKRQGLKGRNRGSKLKIAASMDSPLES
jgi:hypothetical protein